MCGCQVNHQWIANKRECVRICNVDHYTSGVVLPNDTCACNNGAKWNYYLEKCVALNCGEIAYATGLSANSLSCECQNDFTWNPVEYLCVIDCPNLDNNPLGLPTNTNSY